MIDIHKIMEELAIRRPIFHLEADFQFALAWHIKKSLPESEIRLEFKPFPLDGIYVDIWLSNEGTVIELKYFTRQLESEYGGEIFSLRNQAANPLRRYDFVKDIERIESIVGQGKTARNGFAVLLTNDSYYWRPPSSNWQNTMDAAFRLHEDRQLGGNLHWSATVNKNTVKGREEQINLKSSYHLQWENYSNLGIGPGEQFRYLAVSVST